LYINMFMVDRKSEQDFIWESLEDAFPTGKIKNTDLMDEVAELERTHIINALSAYEGNQTKAARSLNLGRVTFIAKAKKYELV